MSKENKLAQLMSKDKTLVRRVSDIEVDEITLTKKGALGDEADAVLLFKEDEPVAEESTEDAAVLEKEEVATDEVVATGETVLEKEADEEVSEVTLDVDTAVAFLAKEELSDEQKNQIADLAIGLLDSADLGKATDTDDEVLAPAEAATEFPEEAMNLLKSISESIQLLASPKELEKEVQVAKEDTEELTEVADEVCFLDAADQLLRKSQDEKRAQGRAAQETAVANSMASLASTLNSLNEKFTNTQRTLDRACGKDA